MYSEALLYSHLSHMDHHAIIIMASFFCLGEMPAHALARKPDVTATSLIRRPTATLF